MAGRHGLLWVSVVAIASLLGFFDAVSSYAASYQNGRHYLGWYTALSWDLTKWNLWVMLAPLILQLRRRFPVGRPNWFRNLPVYLLAGVGVALLHSAMHILIYFLIFSRLTALSTIFTERYFVLISDFLIGILIYSLILAAGHAFAYHQQVRAGELLAAQLQTQLAQAQLQALKMQLHPHFIFNSLHSISSHLRDTETARTMIARLGDFLRMTLNGAGAQEVSLKQELDFLRCYLDIEQTRFRDRLTVEMDVETETWDARVPNLILQPIVENAVRHGIAPRSGPGRIAVRARRVNGHLQVQIQDNGCGLQNSQDDEALNAATDESLTRGIGLATTRARLAHLYPAAHRLQLRNAPEGGLVVTLEVPFKTDAHEPSSERQSS